MMLLIECMVCHCNVQASQIHQKLVGVGVELKIILATRINPKMPISECNIGDLLLGQRNTSK